MYIDTHCHLNFAAFASDWREVADRAVSAGVEQMIVVGTDLSTSQKAVELALDHPALSAAVGFHPHHAKGLTDKDLTGIKNKLKQLAQNKAVVAIGECGLDYHVYRQSKYSNTQITPGLKIRQKRLFGMQIQLGKELHLPLIIHNREAGDDLLDALNHFSKQDGLYPKGVVHCISGSRKFLKKVLDLDFYVGVDGNVTYSQEVELLAKDAPLDKLLLETDAPYLTPEPLRSAKTGQLRNEPANVKIGAEFLAKLKKTPLNKIEGQTAKNAQQLFAL